MDRVQRELNEYKKTRRSSDGIVFDTKVQNGSNGKALVITVSIFNPGSYSWDYAKENITDSVKLIVDEIDIYPFESVVYK